MKSHKLQNRAADSKDFLDNKPIFMHVSEDLHRRHVLGKWIGEYQVQFVFSA